MRTPPKPSYDLGLVKKLVQEDKILIRGDVLADALDSFGWKSDDICAAILGLKLKHYYKTGVLKHNTNIPLDIYKARGLEGENVYTHFYIDPTTDQLVVSSFKQI